MTPAIDDATIIAAAELAADWGGLLLESVSLDIVRRALRAELVRAGSLDKLRRRVLGRDPDLLRSIRDEVTVRETYFFRNPDQFDVIERLAYQLLATGRRELRVWCAGCATGEEAYSLAATLLSVARDPAKISVLATDVHEQALATAREGAYRKSSLRPSGPLLHPVLGAFGADGFAQVIEPLHSLVRFERHDLREEPPKPAHFDLIMCRNVLVYFARDVARDVCARLASALAPDGILVFGAMDIDGSDVPMLVRCGRAEHQTFQLPMKPQARAPAVRRPPSDEPRPRVDRVAAAIEAHRAALVLVERGRRQDADRALRDLTQRYPDYVPGLLERALFDARHGDYAVATERMRAVLGATRELPADAMIPGVEALPASFYASSAREFLRRYPDPSRSGEAQRRPPGEPAGPGSPDRPAARARTGEEDNDK